MEIHEISSARELLRKKQDSSSVLTNTQKEEYHMLLQLLLHLIHLVCIIEKTEDQMMHFYQLIHQFICTNPVGNHNKPLLHLAISKSTSSINDQVYSNFPSHKVVELLLKCGANVNSVDENKNTALLLCAQMISSSEQVMCTDIKNIISTLLNYGAHIDMCNKDRQVAFDLFNRDPWITHVNVNPFEHLTLRCLSARVIKNSQVPYDEDDIPHTLVPFIDMH